MYLSQESTSSKVLHDVELSFACSTLLTITNPAGEGDFNKVTFQSCFLFSVLSVTVSRSYMFKIIFFSPILVDLVDGITNMTLYAYRTYLYFNF